MANLPVGTSLATPSDTVSGLFIDQADETGLAIRAHGAFTPDSTAGIYQVGCLFTNTASTGNVVYQMTGTTASPTWAALENASSGFSLPLAETDGTSTTGNSLALTASTLTTGNGLIETASATTTGTVIAAVAAAGTLTTGSYFRANDGAANVFRVAANGHLVSAQTTIPTITPTTPNGITAAAIAAGSTDTAGVITTTGTQDGSGDTVLDVTFNKAYGVAPKVVLQALNASASKAAATTLLTAYVSATATGGFTITVPEDASAGATPSWAYMVIG
jgi:hypothetical protein